MPKHRVLVASLFGVLLAAGADRSTLARQAPNAGTITQLSIRSHMEFLASDAMNGRGSGTRDEWVAATYIGSQIERWGIEPLGDNGGFVQTVDTPRGELAAPPVLAVGDRQLVHGAGMLVQGVGNPHASGPLFKFASGTPVPAGAVVLMPDGAISAADNTATASAAAVLTNENDSVRARWDATAANKQVTPAPTRPWRIVLSKAEYAAVSGLAAGVVVKIDADIKPGHTWNAIGKITGSDPARAGEVILLTAHLDHLGNHGTGPDTIYNGADDDASGSTAVLELAEAIAKGPKPKRTVIFAWFGSEESGGFGAKNFVDHPPVPLDHIAANLEFEMLGRPDEKVPPHTLWLTGYERTNLGPELAKQGARIVQDPHPEQGFFARSDNIQLAYAGVVAQTVSSFNLHKDYHQPSDEISRIDFAHMTEAIQSMLAPVEFLLSSTFKPDWLPGMKPVRGGRGGGRN